MVMKANIYIIGVGGVGSWLAPAIILLTSKEQVTLIDGDRLEDKNLDRQLFNESDINKFKSEALAEQRGCKAVNQWFCEGLMRFSAQDWLLVCVDNHPARRAALGECDRWGCKAIFAANETHSSEAYLYRREWRDSELDPRVYIPEILTDKSNDPRRAAIGCTGEAQQENPQLVTSNCMAAALAGKLFSLWHFEAPKVSKSTQESLCFKFVSNLNKMESFKVSDFKHERTELCQS